MNRQTLFLSIHIKKSFYIKIFFIICFVSLFFYAKIDGKTALIREAKQLSSQLLYLSQEKSIIEEINWNGQDASSMEIKISVQSSTSIARIHCELYCVKEEGETITRRSFWQEESPQQKYENKYKNIFYFQPFGSVTVRAWAIDESGKKLGVTEQTIIGESAIKTMIGEVETSIDEEREKILENPQNDTADEVRETNTQFNINNNANEQTEITTETTTKTTTQTVPKSSEATAVSSTSNEIKNSESIQKHEEKISDKDIEKEISNRVREEVKKQLQEKDKNEKAEDKKENDAKQTELSVARICYFLSILLFIIILGKEFFCI